MKYKFKVGDYLRFQDTANVIRITKLPLIDRCYKFCILVKADLWFCFDSKCGDVIYYQSSTESFESVYDYAIEYEFNQDLQEILK